MPSTLRSFCFALSCVFVFCAPLALAKDKKPIEYPESGKVLATSAKGMHVYQVETDSRVYLLLCGKTGFLGIGAPACELNGKPIAAGDTLQFRLDGDWAHIPEVGKTEDGLPKTDEAKLRILTVELKSVPAPAASVAGANAKGESGTVLGTGMHIRGDKHLMWSTDPTAASSAIKSASFNVHGTAPAFAPGTPVIATAPVTIMPATGGAPVMVMPTAPVVPGGIITGMPVTGGAPIMGVPTGPVAGAPAAQRGGGGGASPPWVHLMRVQAGDKIYSLECSREPCAIHDKPIALGDPLSVRVDKKSAYVAFASDAGAKEEKFKILNEKDDEPAPAAK